MLCPLALPDFQQGRDAATLSQYEAVALFVQRAKAARDSFAMTDENAPAVAEICSRLDGLPLAIELAAARIKLFPPQALLQRLDRRLKFLTGGARDRPRRQQTLRGAIDWSYLLLTEEERVLFARLSVFVGGCTLDTVEAIGNAHGDLDEDSIDGISSLVEKSLVRRIEDDSSVEPRFALLETIREYAGEKLVELGEAETVRDLHCRYFTALAETGYTSIIGEEGVAALNLRELARRLRFTVQALYKYYPSKAALYDALFREGVRTFATYWEGAFGNRDSCWEKLEAGLDASMRFAHDFPELNELAFSRPVPGFVPSEESMRESRQLLATLDVIIERAIADGELRTDVTPDEVRNLYLAMLDGLTRQHVANEPDVPIGSGRFGSLVPAAIALFRSAWDPGNSMPGSPPAQDARLT